MTRKMQLLKDHAGHYVGDLIDATKSETRMLEAEGIATRIIGPVETVTVNYTDPVPSDYGEPVQTLEDRKAKQPKRKKSKKGKGHPR